MSKCVKTVDVYKRQVLNIAENCNKTYTFKAVNKAGVESNVSDGVVVMIDKSLSLIHI